MARCVVGEKKVEKYRLQTGLPIVTAFVRGGTDHRVDLCLEDGTVASLYRDGTIERDPDDLWDVEDWKRTHQT